MDSGNKIKLKTIVLLMIHFGAEAQQNVMAAKSCKFFSSLTVGVNTENNLDSSTEKEMMPSITVGYG